MQHDEPNTWRPTSSQFGQTMAVDKNKYGVFTDEEAPKKSATDCISKCAVMLGIGADVYLGLFDDNKYVNERRDEETGQSALGSGARAPSASPQQPAQAPPQTQAAARSTPAANAQADLDYARGAFTAIRQQIAQATEPADVKAVMTANEKQLADIKRIAGDPHWQKLARNSAKARIDMLSPEAEPVP